MLQVKHWQDAVNAVLGVWLVLSPWALGFQADMTAMSTAVVIGVLLVAAALGALLVPRAWEEWSEGVLGVLMIISPWVLGYSARATAMHSAVVTGIIIVALSAWTLATDKDYSAWMRKHEAQ